MDGIQSFMEKMSGHDCIGQTASNQIFIRLELFYFPGLCNISESQMGVTSGAAMAGKMFQTTENALPVVCLDPLTGVDTDCSGRRRKAALKSADHRIFWKSVDINDWGKIKINSHGLQGVGSGHGMDACQGTVIFLTKIGGACRCWKAPFRLESANFSAFLVNPDE